MAGNLNMHTYLSGHMYVHAPSLTIALSILPGILALSALFHSILCLPFVCLLLQLQHLHHIQYVSYLVNYVCCFYVVIGYTSSWNVREGMIFTCSIYDAPPTTCEYCLVVVNVSRHIIIWGCACVFDGTVQGHIYSMFVL